MDMVVHYCLPSTQVFVYPATILSTLAMPNVKILLVRFSTTSQAMEYKDWHKI